MRATGMTDRQRAERRDTDRDRLEREWCGGVDAKAEPIALQRAATFVMPVLAQIPAGHADSASGGA